MVLILFFLFLVVYLIVVFGNEYKVLIVFLIFYVFVGGLILVLVFKGLINGNKFIGWEKIRIEWEIEIVVIEYIRRNSVDIEFWFLVLYNNVWVDN